MPSLSSLQQAVRPILERIEEKSKLGRVGQAETIDLNESLSIALRHGIVSGRTGSWTITGKGRQMLNGIKKVVSK